MPKINTNNLSGTIMAKPHKCLSDIEKNKDSKHHYNDTSKKNGTLLKLTSPILMP